MLRILLLLTIVPLIELMVLIKVGQYIGAAETVAIVVLAGLLGAWLVRRQGLRTLDDIRRELASAHLPADKMVDALLILVAGVLLVTPGLITDAAGFLLLVPSVRNLVKRFLKARFKARLMVFRSSRHGDDGFIDIEARSQDSPGAPSTRQLEEPHS